MAFLFVKKWPNEYKTMRDHLSQLHKNGINLCESCSIKMKSLLKVISDTWLEGNDNEYFKIWIVFLSIINSKTSKNIVLDYR